MTHEEKILASVVLMLLLVVGSCDTSVQVDDQDSPESQTYVPAGETITDSELVARKDQIAKVSDVGDLLSSMLREIAPNVSNRVRSSSESDFALFRVAAKNLEKEIEKGKAADLDELTRQTKRVEKLRSVYFTDNEERYMAMLAARIHEIDPDFANRSVQELKEQYFGASKMLLPDCRSDCEIGFVLGMTALNTLYISSAIGCALWSGPFILFCEGAAIAVYTAGAASEIWDLSTCVDACGDS